MRRAALSTHCGHEASPRLPLIRSFHQTCMTEERAGLPIIAFNDLAALERWLEAQPANSPGLWIKLAKAHSGIESVTKTDAINAAL